MRREAARNATEVFSAQVEICDERLEELRRLKAVLPEQIRCANGVDVAAARLEQAKSELARLDEQRAAMRLKAPVSGTVGVFRRSVGELILSVGHEFGGWSVLTPVHRYCVRVARY